MTNIDPDAFANDTDKSKFAARQVIYGCTPTKSKNIWKVNQPNPKMHELIVSKTKIVDHTRTIEFALIVSS